MMMTLPVLLFAQKASPGDKILGVWYNGEKTSKIEIFKTTKGDYAGRIIWLKVSQTNENGKPRNDDLNPKEEHRSRALLNLTVMHSLALKEIANLPMDRFTILKIERPIPVRQS